MALLATHPGPLLDYAYVNGGIVRITSAVAPTIAVPTTAGTGSEVGRAAMINVGGRKLDFLSPHLFPARALCDPELTLRLPPYLTAATGMDALTHCIETYLSPLVNPPAEAIALDGVERAASSIEEATTDGRSRRARWNMMMASMEGALSFQKGLGAVHAIAHPLGALDDLSLHHGTLNAVLLPAVLRFNEPAAPAKYERLRQAAGLDAGADLAEWISELNGGPTAALQVAQIAGAAGLGVMVGSVIEMGVATAMGLHLAAALPRLAYPSYLMGPLKYREQITTEQIAVVDSHVAVPSGPGLGIEIDQQALGHLDARRH